MATALALKDVNKLYERRGKTPVHAVKTLNMDVQQGEIVALLGSSGCGKTSTLRMIAGFEEATSGTITLAGRTINTLPPSGRNVAMAFEGYSLYPPLTVRENIAFALKSARVSRDETDRRVAEIAAWSRSSRFSTATLRRSRAASSNAPRWRAPSCVERTSTCSTSRWASWSRSCAPSCGAASRTCSISTR